MREIKLTIDEVIGHCNRTVERTENIVKLQGLNPQDEIMSKNYWEHKQVAEWLKELKNLRGAIERILERLEEEQKGYIYDGDDYCEGAYNAYGSAISAVKEEGGIE